MPHPLHGASGQGHNCVGAAQLPSKGPVGKVGEAQQAQETQEAGKVPGFSGSHHRVAEVELCGTAFQSCFHLIKGTETGTMKNGGGGAALLLMGLGL